MIKAPKAGTIAVDNAVPGQYVTAGTTLATAYDNVYVTEIGIFPKLGADQYADVFDEITIALSSLVNEQPNAYDVLRGAILSGQLAPGARIVEADIARQMAISRSPVREAVRKLEREGLVEYVPRRGTVVVGLSRDDVEDAYSLRAHLEAYAARLAAVGASEAQLAGLAEMLERMRGFVSV